MFKKTGKTTTLGVTESPKKGDRSEEAKPKEDSKSKKPQDNQKK